MISFMVGFIIAGLLGMISDYSYKRCLIMAAENKHSEKILGKWYRIDEEK
jgi:hypothetical protein